MLSKKTLLEAVSKFTLEKFSMETGMSGHPILTQQACSDLAKLVSSRYMPHIRFEMPNDEIKTPHIIVSLCMTAWSKAREDILLLPLADTAETIFHKYLCTGLNVHFWQTVSPFFAPKGLVFLPDRYWTKVQAQRTPQTPAPAGTREALKQMLIDSQNEILSAYKILMHANGVYKPELPNHQSCVSFKTIKDGTEAEKEAQLKALMHEVLEFEKAFLRGKGQLSRQTCWNAQQVAQLDGKIVLKLQYTFLNSAQKPILFGHADEDIRAVLFAGRLAEEMGLDLTTEENFDTRRQLMAQVEVEIAKHPSTPFPALLFGLRIRNSLSRAPVAPAPQEAVDPVAALRAPEQATPAEIMDLKTLEACFEASLSSKGTKHSGSPATVTISPVSTGTSESPSSPQSPWMRKPTESEGKNPSP